jgi:hypothetical protein
MSLYENLGFKHLTHANRDLYARAIQQSMQPHTRDEGRDNAYIHKPGNFLFGTSLDMARV